MRHLTKLKTLKKSKFFKNVFAMVSGTTLAQLLPLAVSPLLTRYYTDADFGIMGSITSISAILAVAISGRYQLAIMLPKSEQKAYSLSILSIAIALIGSILLLGLVIAFPKQIESVIGIEGINRWLIYIPFAVFSIGLWNTLNIWVSRAENFKINAVSKVIQASSNASIGVLFSKLLPFYFSAGGMIVGRIGGFAISSLNMLRYYVREIRLSNLTYKLKEIKEVASTYKEYPKYSLVPALLNAFSQNAMFLLIGKYFSVEYLGHYNLANYVLLAPITLISMSIRDVLYKRFTSIVHDGNNPLSFLIKSAKWLFIIGSPVFFIPFFAGPFLFSLIFGNNWIIAGQFAAILSFSYWIKLVISPLSSVFNSINRIKIASFWQVAYTVTTIATLAVSVYFNVSLEELLFIYAVHEVVQYSIYFALAFYYTKTFNSIYGNKQ